MTNPTLLQAHDLLRKVTPLRYDCGRLCDCACCRGDAQTGMRLFPFEQELLANAEGFTYKDTESNQGHPILICNGSCERRLRPLACRMFPLFPLVTRDETADTLRVSVVYDPRAKQLCPLAAQSARLDPSFVRAVRRTGKLLLRDPILAQYLLQTSEELLEYMTLEQLLGQ